MCLLLYPTTGPKIAAPPSLNTSGFLRWSHSRAHKNTIIPPTPPPVPLPAVTRASRSVRVCAYPSRALSRLLNGLQRSLCGALPASRITYPDEPRSVSPCRPPPFIQLGGGAASAETYRVCKSYTPPPPPPSFSCVRDDKARSATCGQLEDAAERACSYRRGPDAGGGGGGWGGGRGGRLPGDRLHYPLLQKQRERWKLSGDHWRVERGNRIYQGNH